MDFIERWLGIAPDGGDGTFEAFLILALVVGLGVVLVRKRLNVR